MELKELLTLNQEGLIPGPGESEAVFRARIASVKAHYEQQQDQVPAYEWHWAAEQLREHFDFSPRWCTAYFSSHKLTPWQAAATWIDSNRVTSIQLNPSRILKKLIDRREILAHEAVHAARASFDEPVFEEFFAYFTSGKSWRRVLGPLFQSPAEALTLILLAFLGAFSHIIETLFSLSFLSTGLFFLVFLLLFFWSARLFRSRLVLKRAAKHLIPRLQDPKMLRSVLFRLTDEEIAFLAHKNLMPEKDELRWTLIKAAYLT